MLLYKVTNDPSTDLAKGSCSVFFKGEKGFSLEPGATDAYVREQFVLYYIKLAFFFHTVQHLA